MSTTAPGIDLQVFQEYINRFTEGQLRKYIDYISTGSVPQLPKEFSDPIWATIYLTPFEVVITDSPLFQRLRLIKQLGVIHWVYPGAVHSRFEHSLGALYQLQQLLDSIQREGVRKPEVAISDDDRCLLRMTALCHDIGHGLMSHVSENALRNSSEAENLRLAFADEQEVENPHFSEMVAFYMLGSPAFRDLVAKAKETTHEKHFHIESIEKARQAIIGKTISNKVPLLQELISGPFDCDKLDYMQRDATMAGVPIVTDVARLVRKIRAVAVSKENLPEEIGERVDGGQQFYIVFGLAFSGARTLDELLLGRILLFDKLYRHHKVRAIEGMVCILILRLSEMFRGPAYMLPYSFSDEQLQDILPAIACQERFDFRGNNDENLFAIVRELSTMLRTRRLYVRAFAFAKNMPGDPYRESPTQRIAADRLLRSVEPTKRVAFTTQVALETLRIIELLGETKVLDQFNDKSLNSYIFVDPPEAPAHAGTIPHAYLLADDGRIGRFGDTSTEVRSWTDAYLFAKDVGFVFSPAELKPFVFIAVELITRRDFDFRIPKSIFDYLKEDRTITNAFKQRLLHVDYYKNAPYDIRPIPKRLEDADVARLFETVREKFQGYNGPRIDPTVDNENYLDDTHLENWTRQFEDDKSVKCACEILKRLILIGRRDILRAVSQFIAANSDFKDANIAPLGDIKDSGPTVAYYVGDIPNVTVMSLKEALTEAQIGKPIILVDDFIGSGTQAVTIIETLLGLPLTRDCKEKLRLTLLPEERIRLKRANLGFVYAAGWSAGEAKMSEACTGYGLTAKVHVEMKDAQLPSVFDPDVLPNEEERNLFIEKCTAVGRGILFDPHEKHDEEWVKGRELGYGNKGLLISFAYNTPSQTLACLWKRGMYNGLIWEPLFPRRKKE
jgi:HD superfamily phosphohydrolase